MRVERKDHGAIIDSFESFEDEDNNKDRDCLHHDWVE